MWLLPKSPRRFAVVSGAALLIGCHLAADLDDFQIADSDAAGSGGAQQGAGGSAFSDPCNAEGAWKLTELECGESPIDVSRAGVTMDIDTNVNAMCDLSLKVSTTACSKTTFVRTEQVHVPGGETIAESYGYIECEPEKCTLSDNDTPCTLGSGASDPAAIGYFFSGDSIQIAWPPTVCWQFLIFPTTAKLTFVRAAE